MNEHNKIGEGDAVSAKPKNVWRLVIVAATIVLVAALVLFLAFLLAGPIPLCYPKIAQAKCTIGNLSLCIGAYKNDYGVYPDDTSSETVISALTGYKNSPTKIEDVSKDSNWHGPYIETRNSQHENGMKNKALLDPWGTPYQFNLSHPRHNTNCVDIWSYGPNRKNEQGGGDDICNWDR